MGKGGSMIAELLIWNNLLVWFIFYLIFSFIAGAFWGRVDDLKDFVIIQIFCFLWPILIPLLCILLFGFAIHQLGIRINDRFEDE